MRETSSACLWHMPQLGTQLATQAHALTGIKLLTSLSLCGLMPHQLHHMCQGYTLPHLKHCAE